MSEIRYANLAVWRVIRLLKSERTNRPLSGGVFPQAAARSLGLTRLEAELALKLAVEWKGATYRSDGRYFYWEMP